MSFTLSEIILAKDFEEEKQKRALAALVAVGAQAAGNAAAMCRVDTGLLRNSITFALAGNPAVKPQYKADHAKAGQDEVARGEYEGQAPGGNGELSVYIGTNVEYAPCVELGVRGRPGHPFLKPAIMDHRDEYEKIMKKTLEGK